MFVRLENTPRDYAWGSTTAIAELLGRKASGGPEAELWLGTHSGSPTRIANPAQVGGYSTLTEWVAAKPELKIGFLLKILAADHPLSLQAHPTIAQARDGYDRENAAGVPLTALRRNYKDRNHKPELIVALSPTFDALCGFRPREETLRVLREFIVIAHSAKLSADVLEVFAATFETFATDEAANAWALQWLLTGSEGTLELVSECVDVATTVVFAEASATASAPSAPSPTAIGAVAAAATVRELAAEYPGDPGIVLALLLNRVRLARGEALYLPAGNMHAYLRGLGVELMATSDNVLRGGLTPKHIDVAELLTITQCQPLPVPRLAPRALTPGIEIFDPGLSDFALLHVVREGASGREHEPITFDGPAIIICTEGAIEMTGKSSSVSVRRGDFFFVTPDEGAINFEGIGEIFAARRGLTPVFGQ
ncbi:mannose-6-phosphate isomerase, class I [Alpinimonas psychrophila]|uniref:mannose-6-phosphate isomerase n=1 Tax=Alpinimonas psychrophila TaxID=748908 RepID=A0A7W3JU81_9MICO|nr:mannose-6-phosphate isomerase, class I [Alpinimonas psychrophila]MBA8829192.1 mannose-6-phosphate isomerase [Alpinimonas psychrophila]